MERESQNQGHWQSGDITMEWGEQAEWRDSRRVGLGTCRVERQPQSGVEEDQPCRDITAEWGGRTGRMGDRLQNGDGALQSGETATERGKCPPTVHLTALISKLYEELQDLTPGKQAIQ